MHTVCEFITRTSDTIVVEQMEGRNLTNGYRVSVNGRITHPNCSANDAMRVIANYAHTPSYKRER